MPDDLVTLRLVADYQEAELLRELLAREGIEARVPGAEHRSQLGLLGAYIQLPLRVSRGDEARARELLDALEAGGVTDADLEAEALAAASPEPERPEDDDPDDWPGPPGERPRLRRVAFFIAFAVPGGGHFYARRPGWGALLLGAEAASLGVILSGEPILGFFLLVGMVLADATGAASRVGEQATGRRPARVGRILARGLAFGVAALAGLALAVTELAPGLAVGGGGREVCAQVARCGGEPAPRCRGAIARWLRQGRLEGKVLGACAECVRRATCEELSAVCTIHCGPVPLPWERVQPPPPEATPRLRIDLPSSDPAGPP